MGAYSLRSSNLYQLIHLFVDMPFFRFGKLKELLSWKTFSSVQFSSVAQSRPTLCNPMNHSTPGLPVHHQLPEFTQTIESVMPSSHLIFCCPLLLLPPILPSIRDFSNESTLHMRWPKYWSFIFSISPSNEHPGLISFKRSQTTAESSQGVKKSKKNH